MNILSLQLPILAAAAPVPELAGNLEGTAEQSTKSALGHTLLWFPFILDSVV